MFGNAESDDDTDINGTVGRYRKNEACQIDGWLWVYLLSEDIMQG